MIRRVPIGALGHPLYVNGRLFPDPVVISHVPGVGSVDPSMGGLGAYVGYRANLGADEVLPGASPASLPPAAAPPLTGMQIAYAVASTAATVGGIYHGYKRNDSIGWAIWWGLMAGAFPVITIPIALAQGFGKRKGMTPNARRRAGKRRRSRVTVKWGNSGNIVALKNDLLDDAESLHYPDEFTAAERSYIKKRVRALRKQGWKPKQRRRR